MGGGSVMALDERGAAFIASFVSRFTGETPSQELKVSIPSGGEEDVRAVCINLVNSAGPSVVKALYGEESRPQVDEWLLYASVAAPAGQDPAVYSANFRTLDTHLLTRSVLVGNGTTIGITDIAVFVALHDSLAALSLEERKSYPNLLRWIDYVQNKYDSSHAYEWIPVEKSKFDPPVSSVESDSKKVFTSPPGLSVKNEAGTGTTMTSAIDLKPTVKEVQQEEQGKLETVATGKVNSDNNAKKVLVNEAKEPAPIQKDVPGLEILDIRVGTIVNVKKHPSADTLYVEEIDIGEGSLRQVVSGLAKYLTEAQMLNRRVLVLANVKPSKLRDVLSSGLVLCASNEDHSHCEPLIPPQEAIIGERVIVAGYEGKPEAVLNPKKKQWEKLYPDLHTDETGVACFQGKPLMTSAGPCTSTIIKGTIK